MQRSLHRSPRKRKRQTIPPDPPFPADEQMPLLVRAFTAYLDGNRRPLEILVGYRDRFSGNQIPWFLEEFNKAPPDTAYPDLVVYLSHESVTLFQTLFTAASRETFHERLLRLV